MKIGCCVSVENMEKIESIGYDFAELGVANVRPDQPEAAWEPVRERILKYSIKPEAWNGLFPADLKVVGPDVNWQRVHDYLETAFKRISGVGGRIIVFGSGGARYVPEGFPHEEAEKQIKEMLLIGGDLAEENGLKIVIEPLNRKETNILNSVPEALSYVQELEHPSVGVLADNYHMYLEHQPVSDLLLAKGSLFHVHLSDAGRRYPKTGEYDFQELFDALWSCGYDARVSVECAWGDDIVSEYKSALQFLRKFTNSALS